MCLEVSDLAAMAKDGHESFEIAADASEAGA